ncbi:MAG: SDR family NAD(P)-dependent oxidoreductase [Alphaproteobacteria bacterium]|nr:SDR family NAD(P)-dependent oxidoreductase [Alphaproteobacteria bacterium]
MATPIKNWVGKRVWVIGASFGIGHALAQGLAQQGAILILSGRTKAALEELRSGLPGKGHLLIVSDVGSEESLKKSFKEIIKKVNDVDVIIYCAGTYHPGLLLEGSNSDFTQTFDTNFLGVLRLLQVAAPHFSEKKSCQMVFMGSIAAYSGLPNSNVYGPSKAALLNFCEGMKIELESKGIDIRIVSPGFVSTRLTDKNPFPMPLIISPEKAASYIIKGLGTRSFQIDFPKPMSLFLRFLRLLPYPLYFWIVRRTL